MLELLWLIPAFPLAGFLVLALAGPLPRPLVSAVGVGSIGVSAILTGVVGVGLLEHGVQPGIRQVLWTWMEVGGLTAQVAFFLDALSLVMAVVITGVGFLIHLYSVEYMQEEDEGYKRFFAYMNLFVAAMLTLVLADNLLLLFVGWEGVGLCSYLLIGFWYREAANGAAGRKAFLVNRIGDTALVIGLLFLVTHLGTLDIQALMARAAEQWPVGATPAIAAAALLLGGAVGKSAQIPLHVWLPAAMAGPTPVSALIHAATMVTAGVYLIARTHVLYDLAPPVQAAVAVIGALTLLLAAFSALGQRDIKRILAFSTISQIGYMFLALGVGAESAALFHFATHAFFKALLFLAAGVIILSLQHEQDLFNMGGLRADLPLAFWTTLIGAASLAGVPLLTAGFFSKDEILWEVWSSPRGGRWLWGAGFLGVLLTALYSFRLVFLAFFGRRKREPTGRPGWTMRLPLMALSVGSIAIGWLQLPATMGNFQIFGRFLESALPIHKEHGSLGQELTVQIVASAVTLLGIGLAYVLWVQRPAAVEQAAVAEPSKELRLFARPFWWAARASKDDVFDRAYDRLIVTPFLRVVQANRDDLIDRFYDAVARAGELAHEWVRHMQTGQVRWYATVLAAGSVTMMAIVLAARG